MQKLANYFFGTDFEQEMLWFFLPMAYMGILGVIVLFAWLF
ncbi:hypothetical protein [Gracilibacillus dipsosauri]